MALASFLSDKFDVCFCLVDSAPYVLQMIEKKSFRVIAFGNEGDFFQFVQHDEFVLTDGYNFDAQYQLEVKKRSLRLICIDDLSQGFFHADLIVNHCPGIHPQHYRAASYTRFCLGPAFALIRPEFQEAARVNMIVREQDSLLVCFGGSDPQDFTGRTFETALRLNLFDKITLIVGEGYTKKDLLLNRADTAGVQVTVLQSLTAREMVNELSSHALVIVPASGLLFEAIACNAPVISGYYVDNQQRIYEGFKKCSALIDAGMFGAQEVVHAIERAHGQRIAVSKNIIDGMAPERIRSAFEELTLV